MNPSNEAASFKRAAADGEGLRQLTVVFCDLVGSTALSERLDPESLRDILSEYQQAVVAVVERFEGYVAQYQGDGILIYFGYPEAHEDDPRRAVAAALEAVEAIQHLGKRLEREEGVGLSIRLGIHTGMVLLANVGGGGRIEQMALGDTPNLAARLQTLAERDTVVVSAATRRLVEGLFEWESLGSPTLKGIAAPVEVYRVIGPAAAKSRFEAAAIRGLTPFVGRDEELGILRERWEKARDGSGQVVLIGAEPGLGKSRLVHELRERITEDHTAIEFQCSALHRNTALHPVVERLPSLLGLLPEDAVPRKLEALEERLSVSGLRMEQAAPLFASMLSLPVDRYPPLNMSPQLQREKTREVLLAWILAEAERKPLILCFEDLQWADPTTLEFLALLVDRNPTAPILAVFTFRPEFRPAWEGHSYVTQLALGRFDRTQAEALVTRAAGGKDVPAEVVTEIVRKTDGVPLFLEELTRMLLESGHLEARDGGYELTKPITELDIPSTLQGSLMARLDRLGKAKEVAQLGAVIGREFDHELLRAVSPIEKTALGPALSKLVDAELVYQSGVPSKTRYVFKHALVQDAAYQSLLKRSRRELHRKIADTLKERSFEIAESEPEVVAHHYTEAAEIAEAISWWQRAGERAIARNAVEEALAHAGRGVALVTRLREPVDRALAEARLIAVLWHGSALRFGWSSSEFESHLPRITQLIEDLPPSPELAFSLYVRGNIEVHGKSHHQYQVGRETLERALKVAEAAGDRTLAPVIRTTLGHILILMAEFELALEHLRIALSAYDPERDHPKRSGFPLDARIVALANSGWAWLSLGYPERGQAACEEALARAKAMGHPVSFAHALGVALILATVGRDLSSVAERASTLIDLATEQKLPMWAAEGRMHLGSMAIEQGNLEEGIRLLEESCATAIASAASTANIMLAGAYARLGRSEEASRILAGARDWVQQSGERGREPLIEATAAILAFVRGDRTEAQAHLRQGVEICRRQKAKLTELQFATMLAQSQHGQREKEEARRELKATYDWFTEGFDTPILKEARALLDELAS